ncbi:prolyl oligopeptidase family protein [Pedobacter sp. SYP-B3415]|uniref:prolyl oligopeptidase family serine peptidase n=1 Tax=Pedobacter sp. SYP-B3415 TaxID=2496641 RepID=UPI00101CB7A9|nr:prolyl oligopeptidase family serine peptidase [Pedobacter sp. SYP-B3415]
MSVQYPISKKTDQTDNYHGTVISDPYRWLEDDQAADTGEWVRAQNEVTENYLSKLPFRQQIHTRLTRLSDYPRESAPVVRGELVIYSKNTGLQNQAVLYVQHGLSGEPEILIDPNTFSDDGTVALQATAFSKTQKYFAYSVAASGSDWQEIYVMDFQSRKLLAEKITYVKFTGISWAGDEGFYYSGYDRPADEAAKFSAKNEFQKVYYHRVGTPQEDDILIYQDPEHPLRYVDVSLTEDERFLVLHIAEGTDGTEIKVRDLQAEDQSGFTTLVAGFGTNAAVIDNIDGKLLIQTNAGAPRFKVVMVDPAEPGSENWQVIIAEAEEPLIEVGTGGGKLFASYLKDAATEVIQYSRNGSPEHRITLPGPGTASGFRCKAGQDFFFYTFTSFTYPATVFRYDIKTGKSVLHKTPGLTFDPAAFETTQVFYPGKDGTRIPMFITGKKGLERNGENPVLLYAYGGFNVNLTPAFSSTNIVFLENGGLYCVANLRGGGEYGEDWHQAGMLDRKQTVFDDFIAAAEFLIREKYTNTMKLAIRGGSNGGLLVAACMTQRPDLFRVAIPQVGVLDMLRYHKFTVGWGWVVEYGSSDDREQFGYLLKYSPLHNLKAGTCYPATLITTADHDDRVVPAHSFKFAAALQEVQGCSAPVLIRIDARAGHGAGKPTAKLIDEMADVWAFVFANLDMVAGDT